MTNASRSQSQRRTERSRSRQEPGAVIVVVNDVLARISAGHDVVNGAFEFDAKPTGHGRVSSDGPGKTGSPALNPGAPALSRKISHLPSLTPRSRRSATLP